MGCLRSLSAVGIILILARQFVSKAQQIPQIPAMVVFGDSTVDVGMNNNLVTIIKSNFLPYGKDFVTHQPTGRFCNGLLVTDYIASDLNLPFPKAYFDPSAEGEVLLKGVNFASSASGYYDGTAKNFNVISLSGQLQLYQEYLNKLVSLVGLANVSDIISQALFVLSTGSNDYVNNYYINLPLQAQYDHDQFRQVLIQGYKNFVQTLYESGARRIAVVSMPPLGCIPSQITLNGKGTRDCIDFGNNDAQALNQLLIEATQSLNSNLNGLTLVFLDIYNPLFDAAQNPSKYGFISGDRGCCGSGTIEVSVLCNPITPTCPDASKYLWWDSFHPTQTMNKVLANLLYQEALSKFL